MFRCNENIVIMLHLVGLVFLLVVHAPALVRARKGPRVAAYRLLIIMITILLSLNIFEYQNSSETLQYIMIILRIIANLGCAYAFYWFATMVFFNDQFSLRRIVLSVLPILAAWMLAVLIFADNRKSAGFFGNIISDRSNIMFPFTMISAIYAIVGLLLLMLSLKNIRQNRIKLLMMYLSTTLLPLAAAMIYLLCSDRFLFDPVPLTAALVSSLLAFAAVHLQLLDILPVARRDIMNEMDSLLAIVRDDGMIIDCNESFARVSENERRDTIGKNIKELIMPVMEKDNELSNLAAYNELIEAEKTLIKEIELNTISGKRYFEIMVKPFFAGRNKLRGRLFRMTELSRERQLREMLADQNKQLASANYSLSKRTRIAADLKRMTVRNQLARELHDQLGHTIIMALSSIDRIEKEDEDSKRWSQLDELMVNVSDLLQRSLPENESVKDAYDLKDKIFGVSAVLAELQRESTQAGIEVEFDIQGPADDIPLEHLHDLSQIFRETMTNAVKHGNAEKMDYFLMVTDNGYDVIIADNGEAGKQFTKGFGLKGIEKRVESLGGTVRFQSESSGFAVFIKIPLKGTKSS